MHNVRTTECPSCRYRNVSRLKGLNDRIGSLSSHRKCAHRTKTHLALLSWPPKPVPLHLATGAGVGTARKRYSDKDILKLLRGIELKLAAGDDVSSACRSVRISDATIYNWRRRFGGMRRSLLSELKSLEKENARLKKIVAELELDKLILKDSVNHLWPKA